MTYRWLLNIQLFQYALNPLLMLQQRAAITIVSNAHGRDTMKNTSLHMQLRVIEKSIENNLIGFG